MNALLGPLQSKVVPAGALVHLRNLEERVGQRQASAEDGDQIIDIAGLRRKSLHYAGDPEPAAVAVRAIVARGELRQVLPPLVRQLSIYREALLAQHIR